MAFVTTSGNLNAATGANVGIKESIYEQIKLIGAEDTPLMSMIGTSPVTNIKHAWLIDNLAENINQHWIANFLCDDVNEYRHTLAQLRCCYQHYHDIIEFVPSHCSQTIDRLKAQGWMQ